MAPLAPLRMACIAFAAAFVTPSFGKLFSPRRSALQKHEDCIPLVGQEAYYTAQVLLGDSLKGIDVVVDTGSNHLVVNGTEGTPSTKHTDQWELLGYGSGDALVEVCEDRAQLGSTIMNNQKLMLMNNNDFGFEIDGILPLGPKPKNDINMKSFSLCFQPGGPGALRFGVDDGSVQSSGQWQVSFQDISVDGSPTHITGSAIPDSGTTLLMSPSLKDLAKLYAQICLQWSDCKNTDGEKGFSVEDFLHSVEADCGRTLPPLTFNFGSDALATLPGSSYVFEMDGKCSPAFDVDADFSVWILGLPLFTSNQVNFHHSGKVGFSKGCSSCGGDLKQQSTEGFWKQSTEYIWKLTVPPRWPTTSRRNFVGHRVVPPSVGPLLAGITNEDADVAALAKFLHERVWPTRKH